MKTKVILSLLIAFGLSFQSCEKEDDSISSSSQFNESEIASKKLNVTNKSNQANYFEELGIAHNHLLDYYAKSFDGNQVGVSTKNDGLTFIVNNIEDSLQNISFSNSNMYGANLFIEVKDSIKQYIDNQSISTSVLIDTASNNNKAILLLDQIKSEGLISTFEYNSLKSLIWYSYRAKIGELSIIELEANVQEIKNSWSNNDPGNEMIYLASVVSVSEYSINWWEDNTTQGDTTYSADLAPWAAADIAGAIVGAGHQLIVSGELSWDTSKAVLLGGVGFSAGATGRLAKWIGGLF